MTLLSIYMVLVLIARPIIFFNQTTDLVFGYPYHKGSGKVYLFNTDNSDLVRLGLEGRLKVRYFQLVLGYSDTSPILLFSKEILA